MLLVGLTGGIGSGKSRVAAGLVGAGIDVIDADSVAREIVTPGSPVLAELAQVFGDDIIAPDGTLRRRELAARAFVDDRTRQMLDDVTHPHISVRIDDRIRALTEAGADVVVVDHPLLIETGQHAKYDVLVVVLADEIVRRERLVTQRGLEPDDVAARMRAQTDDDTRRALATYLIDNNGDEAALEAQIGELIDLLRQRATSS